MLTIFRKRPNKKKPEESLKLGMPAEQEKAEEAKEEEKGTQTGSKDHKKSSCGCWGG